MTIVKNVEHHGERIVRNVPTTDAVPILEAVPIEPFIRQREWDGNGPPRDRKPPEGRNRNWTTPLVPPSILHAGTPGKVIALGRVWAGGLQSEVDSTIAAIKPAVDLTRDGGRVPAYAVQLCGKLAARIADADREAREHLQETGEADGAELIDLTELMRGLSMCGGAYGDGDPNCLSAMRDFIAARDSMRKRAQIRPTGDSRLGGWGSAPSPADINRQNRAALARKSGATEDAPAAMAPGEVTLRLINQRNRERAEAKRKVAQAFGSRTRDSWPPDAA